MIIRLPGALLALLLLPAALLPPTAAAGEVPVPEGYRMERYRAPVPDHAPGARTVHMDEVRALHGDGAAVFIDVIPATRHDLPDGTAWTRPEPRLNIPGSVWLPNTGYGALEPPVEAWFRANLERLSADGRPLVFYCQADCWMSWNAARRAAAWGYGPVLWFPTGTDDWAAAGLPLEPATAAPWP